MKPFPYLRIVDTRWDNPTRLPPFLRRMRHNSPEFHTAWNKALVAYNGHYAILVDPGD